MRWRSYQWWVLAVVGLFGMTGAGNAQQRYQKDQSDGASHLSPQHREAVEQWLSSRKLALRVATVADCSNKEGLAITRKERGRGYHPYYAVGDFNGDRREDFAIALVNTKKRTAKFSIAVFNGPVRKDSNAAFFREGFDFRRMAFSAAEDFEDSRRTMLFIQNLNTGKGWMISVGRKGYYLKPSQEDFN